MFDKISNTVSKFLPNMKTNLNTGLFGVLSMYLATKGFNLDEIIMWAENIFTSVESLIVVLTMAGVYFRGLANKVKGKK